MKYDVMYGFNWPRRIKQGLTKEQVQQFADSRKLVVIWGSEWKMSTTHAEITVVERYSHAARDQIWA